MRILVGQGIRIAGNVEQAVSEHRPIVAFESTVVSHGLPRGASFETARVCEETVTGAGAVPATIGVVAGRPVIGLNEDELRRFADGKAPDGSRIEKVSLNNLAAVMARRQWGATTVAASLRLAATGGLSSGELVRPAVFSTGGIGGVHRGATDTFDISADLTSLAHTPMVCVCAGAKSVLDLQKTREYLETLGVPVVGYRTEEFPAFYSRLSGLPVDAAVENPDEVAQIAAHHWLAGSVTAILVCVPVPEEFEVPITEVERATQEALEMASRQDIRGGALTPFLLAQMEKLTGGDTLGANLALLTNNAKVAASIAASLSRLADRPDID